MTISVIIPTYNREKQIKRAIESVIRQTYGALEIIIVDDGSTDNTEDVVCQIEERKIKYVRQKNQGACVARNRGIKEASGDYIAFLDSDDEWVSNKLERQMSHINNVGSEVSVCNYVIENNNKTKVAMSNIHSEVFTLNELLNYNYITTGAILIKRELLQKVGMFDEKMPRYQDWELALRIARKTEIPFLNEPLLIQHVQKESISRSTSKDKKFYALERMLEKNIELFYENPKAYAHICWSMGMYSMFTQNQRKDLLWKGTILSGINLKRLCIYFFLNTPIRKFILEKYSRNH